MRRDGGVGVRHRQVLAVVEAQALHAGIGESNRNGGRFWLLLAVAVGELCRPHLWPCVQIRGRLCAAAGKDQIVIVLAGNANQSVSAMPGIAGIAQWALRAAGSAVAVAGLFAER